MSDILVSSRRTFLGGMSAGAASIGLQQILPAASAPPVSIEAFQALVGKSIKVTTTEGGSYSVKLAVNAVHAHAPLECTDPSVRKDPFSVQLAAPLHQRLPEQIFKISGEGLPEMEVSAIPRAELGEDLDHIPYEICFA